MTVGGSAQRNVAAGEAGRVVVVGSINVDVTALSPRMPDAGETITGTGLELGLGGKGANQAAAVAAAGAASVLVGCVGDDPFAAIATGALDEFGVDRSMVDTVNGPTGVAHIRVAGGENSIIVIPLANGALDTDRVDQALRSVADTANWLLVQLEIDLDVTLHTIRSAHALGIPVLLDPAPAAELPDDIYQHVAVVKPNEHEAGLLTGIPVTDARSAEAAGRWFVERGAGAAIITLGGSGSVLVTADGSRAFTAPSVDAVDTTAAGDTFSGYLAATLANGLGMDSAIGRATRAAAIAVTRVGASASIPLAAEVDAAH